MINSSHLHEVMYEDGSVEVVLVASKTRVAPTKRQMTPHLELLESVVLSHLVTTVSASLPIPVPAFY